MMHLHSYDLIWWRYPRRRPSGDGQRRSGRVIAVCVELWAKNGPSAIDSGRRAIALDPNNSDARLFLSLSLSATGQGADGLRQIEAGMALNPNPSAFNLWARGKSLRLLGRSQEALADFKAGIRLRAAFLPNSSMPAGFASTWDD
jgi:tetratricopeptide (TPR) repeat protein